MVESAIERGSKIANISIDKNCYQSGFHEEIKRNVPKAPLKQPR